MIIKKIYDNYEDFIREAKAFKITEFFYNFNRQQEKGTTNVFYLISLSAIIEKEDLRTTAIFNYDVTPLRKITTQEEAEVQMKEINEMQNNLIKQLQNDYVGCFPRKGTLQVEG